MKHIKKFEAYVASAQPQRAPSSPQREVEVIPTTRPETKPGRPSPIRRDKPAVDPAPKASAEDVVDRFVSELKNLGDVPFDLDLEKVMNRIKK